MNRKFAANTSAVLDAGCNDASQHQNNGGTLHQQTKKIRSNNNGNFATCFQYQYIGLRDGSFHLWYWYIIKRSDRFASLCLLMRPNGLLFALIEENWSV
jgi:hypothetical protein